jgi:energy-coupling factor transport system substrate-specific component
MFQAMGVHGPTLSPLTSVFLDVVLLGCAFWLLAKPTKRPIFDSLFMVSLVLSVSFLRVVMQPLPNVQPVTVAALLVGAQLGARRGAAFAVLVAMISNFFMGDGWWTVFQAAGWASIAIAGSRLSLVTSTGINLGRACMASIFAAFWFDFIVSFSILDGTIGFTEFMVYLGHGLPFDFLHMIGNLTFVVWMGGWFTRLLEEDPSLEEIEFTVVNGHGIDG